MKLKLDRIRDYIVNLYLQIRLFLILTLKIDIDDRDLNGYELTFMDDFRNGKLDRSKWKTDPYYGYRYHSGTIENKNEVPPVYYADNIFKFDEDGETINLITNNEPIKIKHIDWNGMNWGYFKILYRTTQLSTHESFNQKYGYYEIRSKMPSEPGQWPAFWLTPKDSWPPEIDIYEAYTSKSMTKIETNVHWGNTPNNKSRVYKHRVKNISKGFHTYSVEWEEKSMKFYYDNILIRVITEKEILKEFIYDMHIIVNGSVHSHHNPEKAKYPTNYFVDYIRAYKKK